MLKTAASTLTALIIGAAAGAAAVQVLGPTFGFESRSPGAAEALNAAKDLFPEAYATRAEATVLRDDEGRLRVRTVALPMPARRFGPDLAPRADLAGAFGTLDDAFAIETPINRAQMNRRAAALARRLSSSLTGAGALCANYTISDPRLIRAPNWIDPAVRIVTIRFQPNC